MERMKANHQRFEIWFDLSSKERKIVVLLLPGKKISNQGKSCFPGKIF